MDTQATEHEHLWSMVSIHLMPDNKIHTKFRCGTCLKEKTVEVEYSHSTETEPKILPAADGHYHCWHTTGVTYATYPPQHPMKCCHCGAEETFSERELTLGLPRTTEHGVHITKTRYR